MQNKTPIKKWKSQRDMRKLYFKDAKAEIDQKNLEIMFHVASITAILIVVFIIATPFIITDWRPTIHYYVFAVLALLLVGYTKFLQKRKTDYHMLIQGSCIFLVYFIFCGLSIIDTLPEPDRRAVFVPLFLAVIQGFFIFAPGVIHAIVLSSEFLYIVYVILEKPLLVAETDIFTSIVGTVLGSCLYYVILKLRVEDHGIRMEYVGLAQADGLTKLLNHEACVWNIEQYLKEKRDAEFAAMLVIDVDNFKKVNDEFGHDWGDYVLAAFAELLKGMFRQSDIVGRFGGDEFIVLMKNVTDRDVVKSKCMEINALAAHIMENEMKISCSIGVAIIHGMTAPFKTIFKVADDNLYEAKSFGKARHVMSDVRVNKPASSQKQVMLVVDDSEVDRSVIATGFSEEYEVVEMASGMEALDYLNQNKKRVAIILLDVVMPEMDGFEVIMHLKKRFDTVRIPIVVISADAENEKKALECGASDMLVKPFDPEIVKLRVKNVMKKNSKSILA